MPNHKASTAPLDPSASPVSPAVSRRRFLTGLALGAGVAPLATMFTRPVSAGRAAAATDLCYAPTKPLIGAQDLSFLGYYDVQLNGNSSTYGQSLTHRYVNGDLRFLTMEAQGWVGEFSLAGSAYGQTISNPTARWNDIGGIRDFNGFYWDPTKQVLWTTSSYDYTADYQAVQIYSRTLNANGTISNLQGPVGLSGINAKRVYGGMQPVPAWFQTQYNTGPYVCGWGGYTSLLAQGGGASLGPTMYAIPDPTLYAANTEVPTGSYRTIMDAWGGDRGSRVTIPLNYFDGGDPRQNPSTPPTDPPVASASWLSPASDGLGRFVWGDSYYNTGLWIDGPSKHGFLMIASLCGGKCWYQSSTLAFDSRVFEVHVFDPAKFGESLRGLRSPSSVKPASMQQLPLPGLGAPWGGDSPTGNVAGATFDSTTSRLYLMGRGINTYYARLYVYQVNA